MKIYRLGAALMAYAVGSILLLSASAAGAAVDGPHSHIAGHGAKNPAVVTKRPHIPFTLPAGYTMVTSTYTASAGVQTAGSVRCPGTEQPAGGGAFVDTADLGVNINSSYPAGGSFWMVDVNNASTAATSFTVYAVCLAYSPYYQVVSSGPWTAYSNWVSSQAAQCPAGTKVTGGGAISNTFATDVNIDSTVPNALSGGNTAWRVAMASYDPNDSSFTVYAVCRPKPAGYSIQTGSPDQMGSYSERQNVVTCPGASVPIGGGGFTTFQSTDVGIWMNSSYPWQNEWVIDENNGEQPVRSLYASAVCAGT